MARKKSVDYDLKRSTIMQQAARLFAEHGFSGASIADISKACGVSKSLVYHYYGSKEDILYGVMSSHVDDLIDLISDQSLVSTNSTEEFLNLTTALLDCYGGAENYQKVLLYELKNLPNEQRNNIIAKQRQIITRFENILARIRPELRSDKGLLRAKIMLFFGMINWTHNWFNPNGPITRDELAHIAVKTSLAQS